MKKEIKETTSGGDIVGAQTGLNNFQDRDPCLIPVKFYPETDTKESFMKRCIATETGKMKANDFDKAKNLCELMYDEFIEQEKFVSNETIVSTDVATKETKLKGFFTRRDTHSKNVSGSVKETIDASLNYLLDMDFVFLSLEQAKTFDTILSDIQAIGSKLNDSHMFRNQASGSRKQAMRNYYRKHKNAILMRRQQLKQHINNKAKEKKKEIMSKSDRNPSGKKKKKNWGSKNHLNEFKVYSDCDYSCFEKAKSEKRRALFSEFLKPLIERKKAFSKLNARLEIITGVNKNV